MGSSVSSTSSNIREKDDSSSSSRTSLGDIPESCISSLLMNLDPPNICKLARVNRAFHRASSSDFVWESKLPSCYKFLASKVLDEESVSTMTKKEIYTKLCRRNLFDGDTKVSYLVVFCCLFVCCMLFLYNLYYIFNIFFTKLLTIS